MLLSKVSVFSSVTALFAFMTSETVVSQELNLADTSQGQGKTVGCADASSY